jgi:dephospho-CoA kinase
VDVNEATQIARLQERDQVSREQAEAALKAQSGRHRRLALADDVIDNEGCLGDLDRAVIELHKKYSALARSLSELTDRSEGKPI